MELLDSQGLGPELRKVVCHARGLGTTWTYLEDHLREQRERIDDLLSSTLKTERPVSTQKLYLYYRRVCQFLDTPEGRSTVSNHVTMDQLDMLISVFPAAESFLWGRRGKSMHPEDTPDVFYEFCSERAEELKAQVLSLRRSEEAAQASAPPHDEPSWKGLCVLGELCGGSHMPEVCQLFEAMTPEGRLAIIQRMQLCQFCFRHPDTQPCPSHSLPIRGCMRMHHRMLHKALVKEEARPTVAEADPELGWHGFEEGSHAIGLEGVSELTDDESQGEGAGGVPGPPIRAQVERPRLCQQRVPVEAEGVLHSLHTL